MRNLVLGVIVLLKGVDAVAPEVTTDEYGIYSQVIVVKKSCKVKKQGRYITRICKLNTK